MVPSFRDADGLPLEDWIRAEATRHGFDAAGITSTEPLTLAGERLRSWLEGGCHAGMRYMALEPDQRSRPARLLPGARSAIVTLTRYQSPAPPAPGQVAPLAAYAARGDYHRTLKARLHELARRIAERADGATYRLAVDTAPLLEKALAARAGLGWIGKSTNLINVRLGCHTLIGTIILDRPLRPDPPGLDHCGRCNRCLDACPTQAFDGPYRLDARRCLAYWTIEHRGPFPASMRHEQGPRLFGCDACLDACPFGRRQRQIESPGLPTDPLLATAPLTRLVTEAIARFKKTFHHTPVPRALKRGFLRNAASALAHAQASAGTTAEERATLRGILEQLLHSTDAAVRDHAAWALGRISPEASRGLLRDALAAETDDRSAATMRQALAGLPGDGEP